MTVPRNMTRARPSGGARGAGRGGPRPLALAIASLRAEVAPPTVLAAVQQLWTDVVGLRIASEAQPVSERRSSIVVECSSSAWASELELIAPELLKKVNGVLEAGAQVAALRFVIRPPAGGV